MSALISKADIQRWLAHVCFVPFPDIRSVARIKSGSAVSLRFPQRDQDARAPQAVAALRSSAYRTYQRVRLPYLVWSQIHDPYH